MWATQEICWTCKIGNITNCVLHLAFFEHYIQYTIHPPYLFLEISFTYCNYNYSKFKKNTKRGRGFPLCATRDLAILAQVLREGRRRGGGGVLASSWHEGVGTWCTLHIWYEERWGKGRGVSPSGPENLHLAYCFHEALGLLHCSVYIIYFSFNNLIKHSLPIPFV